METKKLGPGPAFWSFKSNSQFPVWDLDRWIYVEPGPIIINGPCLGQVVKSLTPLGSNIFYLEYEFAPKMLIKYEKVIKKARLSQLGLA